MVKFHTIILLFYFGVWDIRVKLNEQKASLVALCHSERMTNFSELALNINL
jgi:hypothetical protein